MWRVLPSFYRVSKRNAFLFRKWRRFPRVDQSGKRTAASRDRKKTRLHFGLASFFFLPYFRFFFSFFLFHLLRFSTDLSAPIKVVFFSFFFFFLLPHRIRVDLFPVDQLWPDFTGFTGFYGVWLDSVELASTGFDRVCLVSLPIQNSTGLYWVFLGFPWFLLVLLGFTGFFLVIPVFQSVLIVFTGFLLGYT